MRKLPLSVPLVILLAGCIATPPASPEPPIDEAARLLGILEGLPVFGPYNNASIVDWWDRFVGTYPDRQCTMPQNRQAAAFLESELRAAGFEARTFSYKGPAGCNSRTVPETVATVDYLVVHGLRRGLTSPEHRLALIAHYDIRAESGEGAYDDGAGVAVEMEICKRLAKVPTNKTIECIFFDGEEGGHTAAIAYVKDYQAGGKDWIWDQAFGYDMTGLNWPGFEPWGLWTMIGTDTPELGNLTGGHHDFMDAVLYDFLQLPADRAPIIDTHDRNSDEQDFKRAGIPVIRFAGGRNAADYPMYHRPGDVRSYVYAFACGYCSDPARGRDNLGRGMAMIVEASYYAILGFDRYDPQALPL